MGLFQDLSELSELWVVIYDHDILNAVESKEQAVENLQEYEADPTFRQDYWGSGSKDLWIDCISKFDRYWWDALQRYCEDTYNVDLPNVLYAVYDSESLIGVYPSLDQAETRRYEVFQRSPQGYMRAFGENQALEMAVANNETDIIQIDRNHDDWSETLEYYLDSLEYDNDYIGFDDQW